MDKKIEAVMNLCDGLTSEQKAQVAGLLLSQAGITESTVNRFVAPINCDCRDDLIDFIQDAPYED